MLRVQKTTFTSFVLVSRGLVSRGLVVRLLQKRSFDRASHLVRGEQVEPAVHQGVHRIHLLARENARELLGAQSFDAQMAFHADGEGAEPFDHVICLLRPTRAQVDDAVVAQRATAHGDRAPGCAAVPEPNRGAAQTEHQHETQRGEDERVHAVKLAQVVPRVSQVLDVFVQRPPHRRDTDAQEPGVREVPDGAVS